MDRTLEALAADVGPPSSEHNLCPKRSLQAPYQGVPR
jgi:hypothetical protein